MGQKLPEYDCTKEDLEVFVDMFELYPIYSCICGLPQIEMIQISDGDILSNTWKTPITIGNYWF